jgi:hypothetical protein
MLESSTIFPNSAADEWQSYRPHPTKHSPQHLHLHRFLQNLLPDPLIKTNSTVILNWKDSLGYFKASPTLGQWQYIFRLFSGSASL